MKTPNIGDKIPKRGNTFSRILGQLILTLLGWRFEGEDPANLPKYVLVVAPHTSNWDGFVGFTALFAMGMNINWMGKHTLFKGTLGKVMRWLGGVPIKRDTRHGFVEQLIEQFHAREKFVLAVTPEGTRKKVTKWKTGFYYIALEAKIPIVLAFLDYSRKSLGFGPRIEISGDLEKDLQTIQMFFTKITARHPENFGMDIQSS